MLKEIITGLHQGQPEAEVRRQLKELVQQTDASEIAAMEQALMADLEPVPDRSAAMVVPTGALSLEQLKGIFAVLPVDLTFVDAEDRVRYFSAGTERAFGRSRAILGRKVQHCHPPASVEVVERILADFRAGREHVCSFWLNFRGKFVFIRYFAVRGEQGEYLGTLEVAQDLTQERELQGERRLLQYDSADEVITVEQS